MRLLSIVLLTLIAGPAVAQPGGTPELVVGSRVRVATQASPGDRMKGTISALDEKTLTILNDDHQVVRIPRDGLSHLDVGLGRKTHARRGAVIGGLFMAADAAIYCAIDSDRNDSLDLYDGGPCGAAEIVSSVVFAAGVGAAIGALVKTDRWVPIDTVKIGLALPKGRGVGVSVALRF